MTRVLLVHSPPHGEVPFHNIGLGYLQGTLLHHGIDASTRDLSWDEDRAGTDFYRAFIDRLSRGVGDMGDGLDPRLLFEVTRPALFDAPSELARTIVEGAARHLPRLAGEADVFLFSVNTLTVYFASALASRLREQGGRCVAGGPSLRFGPLRRLLVGSGIFDAVVVGEGEPVIEPLVRALAAGRAPALPGVAHLDADGGFRDAAPASPPSIHDLPPPSFRGTELRDFVPALTSRGCAHRCSFCSEPGNWHSYRVRRAPDVVAEMEGAARASGLREIHFHDDQINGNLPFLDELCALLVERGAGLRWESFCGPQGLTPERLARMRRAGCVRLKMGVQSFSPAVLRRMRRGTRAEALRDAVVEATRAGIAMHYDILTCFPTETEEDHRRNLAVVEALHSAHPELHMSPNPFYLSLGSEAMLRPEEYGLALRYFDPGSLPEALGRLVRAAGAFPVGFRSPVPREVVVERLSELGAVLARHGKDYQYLGKGASAGEPGDAAET